MTTMTISELHKRTIHIDAPVDEVFAYVEDPHHFYEAWDEEFRHDMALMEVNTVLGGVGSTYRMMGRMLGFLHMEWTITREEYVPNERIVDHADKGGAWITTFEPDGTGTSLSVAFGWVGKARVLAEVMDRFTWEGDRDLDLLLGNLKKAIES